MLRIDLVGDFHLTIFAPEWFSANDLFRDGAEIAPGSSPFRMIRLRPAPAGENWWRVKLFESVCHIEEFAA